MSHSIYRAIERNTHFPYYDKDRVIYSNEMYTKYDKARECLDKFDMFHGPTSSTAGPDDVRIPSNLLWEADDKVLAAIIIRMQDVCKSQEANKYLESLCKEFKSWQSLGLHYCWELIRRGDTYGFYLVAQLLPRSRLGVPESAVKMAEVADDLGSCIYRMYRSKALWSE